MSFLGTNKKGRTARRVWSALGLEKHRCTTVDALSNCKAHENQWAHINHRIHPSQACHHAAKNL